MGNHDSYPTHLYLEHFNKLYGSVKIKDVLLTHVPIHESQLNRFRKNIHGHLHSSILNDNRYINVSVERINLTPILLNDII